MPAKFTKETIDALTRKLVDNGFLIEAGWMGFQMGVIDPNAPQIQVNEMRLAFFAGAQHVFASIFSMLDDEAEPTEDDEQRMSQLSAELEAFGDELKDRIDRKAAS